MKVVLFVALPSELPVERVPEGVEVVYTGCGKVNAAIVASRHLVGAEPAETVVVNFGSAGSTLLKMRLYECTKFGQHDMNEEPLAVKHQTPFDEMFYPGLTNPIVFGEGGYACATQDVFETCPHEGFIYDMEAYSLAKVCKKYGFDFRCFKFVSDEGDASDWVRNHDKGIELFLLELEKIGY
jgi:adenosylhomocysteine nucleosidase